jgi:hypothetical protein
MAAVRKFFLAFLLLTITDELLEKGHKHAYTVWEMLLVSRQQIQIWRRCDTSRLCPVNLTYLRNKLFVETK